MKPLNGEKTHPLSVFALGVLKELRGAPVPRSEINPGVANRLERENFAEVVDLPSPFKTRKGKVPHLRITPVGIARLQEEIKETT